MSSYQYSMEFQRHILASTAFDLEFLKHNSETVRPDLFGDDLLQGIADCAYVFFKEHKEVITKHALLDELKGRIAPGRKFAEYAEECELVWAKLGENVKYYQSKAVGFARTQAVSRALQSASGLLESGELDEIGGILADALHTGIDSNGEDVYDYFKGARDRASGYMDETNNARSDRIPCGFYPIDEDLGGGLGKGELGILIALPKHGKTTALVNVAANSVLQGKKVAYFTMELSKKMIASKFDSRFFGRSIKDIKKLPEAFAKKLKSLKDKLSDKLHIIEYPTGALTIDKAQSLCEKIGGVDLVLMDYAQLIKPQIKRDEHRHQLSDIYIAMRGMAGALKVPIWTAHQVNRTGTTVRLIQPEHIAENFNAIAVCDVAISINQLDEERREGVARLYIMASRIGPSGLQVECNVDWAAASMQVIGDEEELG